LLRPGDSLLLGADLKKSAEILIPAYDDALGVTAAFNLNLLVRINRELSGEFDIERFRHRAVYNESHDRMEMHLVSREDQEVSIGAMEMKVEFECGEYVYTESSYKFDFEQIRSLAAESGFRLFRTWYDDEKKFSVNLLRCPAEG
ncbi:MAG: L-histidine N(alpha)-methyltransferase, partial [Proteobacteria bacterium]|nr:L-histidine N(alpha)-methyltransferase [Pseudomonadota bacterium]